MSENGKIEWTDDTWNPTSGCTHAGPDCDNCYAVRQTHRLEGFGQAKYIGLTVLNQRGERHFNGVVRTDRKALELPYKWKRPRRVFVNSMSDLFHKDVPFEFVSEVFTTMWQANQHTYQILTKRPERMVEFYRWMYCGIDPAFGENDWLENGKNIWLGASVGNQATADLRIPHLLRVPAAIRFLSVEPLLGPVDLSGWLVSGDGHDLPTRRIDWVIVGGESGPGARPYVVDYAADIISQCRSAGVAVFHKQLGAFPVCTNVNNFDWPQDVTDFRRWGDYVASARIKLNDKKGGDMSEWPEELRVRQFPKVGAT